MMDEWKRWRISRLLFLDSTGEQSKDHQSLASPTLVPEKEVVQGTSGENDFLLQPGKVGPLLRSNDSQVLVIGKKD